MPRQRVWRRMLRLSPLIALCPLLGGCLPAGGSLLDPAGPVALQQRAWLIEITLWMMIVILPVFILVPLVAWRYRRRRRADYAPGWTFSWPLEFIVWGVPCLVVAGMAWLILAREQPLGPAHPLPGDAPPLQVEVVALDWKWLFIYPQSGLATVDRLVIPRGRQVALHLTSDATMQSFFIPALGSQIYAMAGMVTSLHLRADRPGTLSGMNTQFNGMKFQDDRFEVDVLDPDAWQAWQAAHAGAPMLDAHAYRVLTNPGDLKQTLHDFGQPPDARLAFTAPNGLFASIVAHSAQMPGEMK